MITRHLPRGYWILGLCTVLGWSSAQAAELTVGAASSLGPAFGQLVSDYQARYPDDQVRLSTNASGLLVQQLAQGAPFDVVVTADEVSMDQLASQGLLEPDSRQDFVANQLVLVQPAQTAWRIKRLTDLRQDAIQRIAIGQPRTVPAGRYAQQALVQAGLWESVLPRLVYTQNVRQALDYVIRGEVDAGFVYASDLHNNLQGLRPALKLRLTQPIRYPIAISRQSPNKQAATRWIRFVQSPTGQAVLRQAGFLPVQP